jgi:hypothetical protein
VRHQATGPPQFLTRISAAGTPSTSASAARGSALCLTSAFDQLVWPDGRRSKTTQTPIMSLQAFGGSSRSNARRPLARYLRRGADLPQVAGPECYESDNPWNEGHIIVVVQSLPQAHCVNRCRRRNRAAVNSSPISEPRNKPPRPYTAAANDRSNCGAKLWSAVCAI